MVGPGRTLWALGAFRSGTSLLHSLLNAHPDIALIYELNLHEHDLPPGRPGQDWRARWNRWNGSLARAGLAVEDDPRPPANWEEAARRLFAEYAAAQGASIGGEKSPVYLFTAGALLRERPGDAFLVLWREPADILRSVRRAAARSRYFRKPLLDAWFFVGMENMLAAFERAPNNVHQLSYHRLTAAPEAELAAIWAFLDLPEGEVNPHQFSPAIQIDDPASLHQPVAAGKITPSGNREEVLSAAERQKVARYRQHWTARFNVAGKFADAPDCLPGSPLSPAEAARDRYYARCFQFYNRQIMRLYLRAPARWLDAYRARTNGA